jgi:outer membrane protein assembly factor BamA
LTCRNRILAATGKLARVNRWAALLMAGSVLAHAAAEPPAAPTFRELEAMGARIGEVRIDARNIFDLDDPREDNWLFVLANALHVRTRPAVIRRELLFKPGERVSARLIEETERLLLRRSYYYEVSIVPENYRDGVVDVHVITRDTWTINLNAKYSRSGGEDETRIGIQDTNVAGTALTLGYLHTSDQDRKGTEFEVSYGQAFDGHTQLAWQQGSYDDGYRRLATLSRPFYALDTRWAYGATWERYERTDTLYNAGDDVAEYRHASRGGDAYFGWSRGLVGGWTQRFSLGVHARDDAYAPEPGEVAPAPFPVDHKVRGPFFLHEAVEDDFVRTRNRDQIARTEFAQMGLRSRVQVTRALQGWGSSRSAWLYSAEASDGFALGRGHDLHATVKAERRIDSSGEPLDYQGLLLQYYAPQSRRSAFYGSLTLDRLGSAPAPDLLALGGDTGLRGYPSRYQHGERRALLTLEQRVYSDWYPFRLFRVGGAAFFDVGRAWKGVNPNAENPGWLADAGVGLRLSLDRTAFANVLHIDLAFPFDRAPGIEKVEIVVRSKLTF